MGAIHNETVVLWPEAPQRVGRSERDRSGHGGRALVASLHIGVLGQPALPEVRCLGRMLRKYGSLRLQVSHACEG